ncbi:MAG: D-alanyl-D-alanine carboxypeptidase family protein [Paracoccaceae bacterium]
MLKDLTLRVAGLLVAVVFAALPARAFDTQASAAWVFDQTTHTLLLAKNADTPLPPASMSKLMTLNMVFEALRDGRITLDTTFAVSTKAWKMEGSKMFVEPNDRPTVEDLIHGIIVNSGNDACVVVAEGLAGSEEAFARLMNERARDLGYTQSTFANSSGWPDPNQRMSMHDLGMLAVRLIEEFPEYYGYFGMTEFVYQGRSPGNKNNRNPLLSLGIGADGLKTGHTQEAGYGIVGSAVQGGRRVVFVLNGLPSEVARAEESERVVNWAFRQFVQKTVAPKGTRLAEADVFLGEVPRVPLVLKEDLSLLLPALATEKMHAEVVYHGPIPAPITEGQELGKLIVTLPDLPVTEVPLVAGQAVAEGGFRTRMTTAAGTLARQAMARVAAF